MTADHICWTDDTSCRDCGLPTDTQYVSRGPQDGLIVAMLEGANMLCSYCGEAPVRTAGDAYCEDCLTTIHGQPPVCERCNEPQWTGTLANATPGDWNSPEWCEACRSAHATHPPVGEDGYCPACGEDNGPVTAIPTLWLAEYDTRHYTFTAAGATRDEALTALTDGLARHAATWGGYPDWYMGGYDNRDAFLAEVNVRQITAGHAYRDGSEL